MSKLTLGKNTVEKKLGLPDANKNNFFFMNTPLNARVAVSNEHLQPLLMALKSLVHFQMMGASKKKGDNKEHPDFYFLCQDVIDTIVELETHFVSAVMTGNKMKSERASKQVNDQTNE